MVRYIRFVSPNKLEFRSRLTCVRSGSSDVLDLQEASSCRITFARSTRLVLEWMV